MTRRDELIHGWRILDDGPFDEGGNGAVWNVERDGERAVMKLLKRRPSDYVIRRFQDEITFHQKNGARSGILPMRDGGTAAMGPQQAVPFLVMPLAEPIRHALAEADVRAITLAIRDLPRSLAPLHADGIEHRDIKPGNLFRLNGEWVFGDWGLVRFPEKDAITDHGKKLGPLYFIADEMLQPGEVVDARPADVYSLAKTFYAVAARAEFPPQGQLRSDSRRDSLAQWTAEPRIPLLDRLLERSTDRDPAKRPTAQEFADELEAWLSPVVMMDNPDDFTDYKRRLEEAIQPEVDRERREQVLHASIMAAVPLVRDALAPAGRAVAQVFPHPEIARDFAIGTLLEGLAFAYKWHADAGFALGTRGASNGREVRFIIMIRASLAGRCEVTALSGFGRPKIALRLGVAVTEQVPVGSALMEAAIVTAGQRLRDAVPKMLEGALG